MLEVSRISRSYGDFRAVSEVSFTIKQGEIVGLLGHNGAGKTTIMKMLSGFLEPNAGTIHINGSDLAEETKNLQQGIGYLPESLPIYPEMSVADYLDYAAELKGLRQNRKHQAIKRAIRATELEEKILAPINTLSRGYKQRVGVAQAILGDPGLLILDEPTNGLDPTQTEHMRQLIRKLAENATVILSTHIMQEVEALCDRVIILRGGKLAVDAKCAELRISNHLFIATSMNQQAADQLLAIAGVESLVAVPEHSAEGQQNTRHAYRLKINDSHNIRTFGAVIAKSVLQQGHELFELSVEQRDLETLFREVNQHSADTDSRSSTEETRHAA